MTVIDLEERRLEKLRPDELCRQLMQLPVRKRLEAILRRPDAEKVVAALAEQDFYFSVKEIGSEDSLPFLALSRVEQLNHLFDMEWWRKDQILPAKALDWLERLSRASEEKLLVWLYHADFELLVVLFKQWIRVFDVPEDTDLLEIRDQLPPNTLDDQFFWECTYPQYEDFLRGLLGLIFEENYGYYKELVTYVMMPGDAEIQEEAYHFHRARMEELAVPDFYDAIAIYQTIRPEEIPRAKERVNVRTLEAPMPSFALALVPQGDFLHRVLLEIQDVPLIDYLQLELASLANKVMVADQLLPESADVLHYAVDKTVAYVNLGLLLKSSGDVGNAAKLLGQVFFEALFRLGHSSVASLRNRMLRITQSGWVARWPGGLNCLDHDWMESADLLVRNTPLILRTSPDGLVSPKEDLFRNMEDLAKGHHFVDTILALEPLFDALQVQPGALSYSLWSLGQISKLEEVTLGSMIWTAAARSLVSGKWDMVPLSVKKWPEIYSRLRPPLMENAIRLWVGSIVHDSTQDALVAAYLNPLFREYEEEAAPFEANISPNPAMAKLFLFTEE